MSIQVISSGFWTSIQDSGRRGFAKYGVPESSYMDSYAARLANLLVGNPPEEAVLEITMTGPELLFNVTTPIAITGLGGGAYVNGKLAEWNKLILIKKNDRVFVKRVMKGVRCYLGVAGGFQSTEIMGSKSFCKGITRRDKVNDGESLKLGNLSSELPRTEKGAVVQFKYELYHQPIMVYEGPDWKRLQSAIRHEILTGHFTVSVHNSRMAYQLEERVDNELPGVLTQPVLPGTVQLTPSGNLIILMRDCQVTGGYPRILQLSERSINILSQKRSGDQIDFQLIPY